jgi:hypothetical protein
MGLSPQSDVQEELHKCSKLFEHLPNLALSVNLILDLRWFSHTQETMIRGQESKVCNVLFYKLGATRPILLIVGLLELQTPVLNP